MHKIIIYANKHGYINDDTNFHTVDNAIRPASRLQYNYLYDKRYQNKKYFQLKNHYIFEFLF